jgi:hypothetical protein
MSMADRLPKSSSSAKQQMAALVWITPHLRTVLAPHIAFSSWIAVALRPANDVERYRRMRVAAKIANFKIAVASIQGITQRRRWLGWSLEAEHPKIPRFAGEPLGLLARSLARSADILILVPNRYSRHLVDIP